MRIRSASLGLLSTALAGCVLTLPGEFPKQEELCSTDTQRESDRSASAADFQAPNISQILVNGNPRWPNASNDPVSLVPGDTVSIIGTHLGAGPDIDFSKILIGNVRILETDLTMYQQDLAILDQVNFERDEVVDEWPAFISEWEPSSISFVVPNHAVSGDLIVQVQKRTGANDSLIKEGKHNVIDAQTSRIIDEDFIHKCDVVSQLSDTKATTPIAITVDNPVVQELVDAGREAFWSWDYNIGVAHNVRNLDWTAIVQGKTFDPITGEIADPKKLFGAIPTVNGEVPSVAIDDVHFDEYPMLTPIPGFLATAPAKSGGNTQNSGYVGYRYAEASDPYQGNGEWIGFNCASCHGYKVTYEHQPGQTISRVIPGLPNPEWTMKWAILQTESSVFDGIYDTEQGPSWDNGDKQIAKDMLLYHMPPGTGEHNVIRMVGEGSHTDNDYQFSPITIPTVTRYLPIRRSLSHTESYVGFEGSYIHSEEPDGAQGNMSKAWLEALTAYMSTLDEHNTDLVNVGMYRWLQYQNLLHAQLTASDVEQPEALTEGEFVTTGWQSYSGIQSAVDKGKAVFEKDCAGCHQDHLGTYSNEQMLPLDQVGRFFAPTIYQKQMQSIRVAFLQNLYWTEHRGLLSDGHVRNLEDLVHPDRCSEGSSLYNQYYTLHEPARPALGGPNHPLVYPDLNRRGDVFRVPKSVSNSADDLGDQRNRFITRHKYFVEVEWDKDHYYWDFQKMRRDYGTAELGSNEPIDLPAAPHPWCANNTEDVMHLVQYLLTL